MFRKYGHEKKNRRFRILDASCGIGRHSVMLAGEGYEVVGYDPSQAFIERARELARERNERGKSNIRFYRGPITEIRKTLARSGESGFDAIISMGAAFGYSGREKDDLSLFKDLNKLASDGCVLVAETFNRDFQKSHWQKYLVESFPSSNLQRITTTRSRPGSRIHVGDWDFYRREGKNLKHLLSIRIRGRSYNRLELENLLKRAGWYYLNSYGSISNLTKLAPEEDPWMVLLARKKRIGSGLHGHPR